MEDRGLTPAQYEPLVRAALLEDLGAAGDITTDAIVGGDARARGEVVAREDGIIAGVEVALASFTLVDPSVEAVAIRSDGESVGAGALIARIEGPARSILRAERTALNFLGHMSGVATATARLVVAVTGTGARIADTRKTTPGMRALEKYAVRIGGGMNHRFGLYDAVLVKDNHVAIAGSISGAVKAVLAATGHTTTIEVEVDGLDQLDELLPIEGVDAVLLDNMDVPTTKEAVDRVDGRFVVEASGGVTPDNIREIAETGVDVISVGWLTHSAPRLDVALEVTTFESGGRRAEIPTG